MLGLLQILHALCDYDVRHLHDRDDSTKERHCDLVMKGGITSGVVYPLALLELAKRHSFHAIGGTSAGAIAAVVTAAAEYGRDSGGFQRLIDTVEQLQQPSFVANVFQPAPSFGVAAAPAPQNRSGAALAPQRWGWSLSIVAPSVARTPAWIADR